MDLREHDQILTIKKSLTIKWLRFSKKRFRNWVYHIVLHYILNSNNKFGMQINIKFSNFCDVLVKWPIHIFRPQKFIITNKWIFIHK
jgi:hypothetical protein